MHCPELYVNQATFDNNDFKFERNLDYLLTQEIFITILIFFQNKQDDCSR